LETKKDILWRSYLIYLLMLVLGTCIFGKAVFIQRVEGAYWKSLSDSLHQGYQEMDAERGTIYSEDGRMLSSSIPFFDIYLDFGSQGVQEKNGIRLKKALDSLSIQLSSILGGGSSGAYKHQLMGVFNREDRYHLLRKNIDFRQYQLLKNISFIKSNKNKSGFIFIEKEKRMAPFGLLAFRTIGLSREYVDSMGKLVSKNVGLEKTYDSLLKGVTGRRLVRRIAGSAFVPVEGSEIEPENGKDIITTIDINIQDVAEQALLKMMEANECLTGTCIVMEVKTGKIKAIANLGRQTDGSYMEDFNYAITRSEPGSTFKLVTMLAALEDQYINLNSPVNLEGGKWDFAGSTVNDSEKHDDNNENVTYKRAFELSSNVGMAKLVVTYYNRNPKKFIAHLERLNLNRLSGINLSGESMSMIPNPSGRSWNDITLPWMSFGYNLSISPLQTLMVYNAVANNGKMLKPYLVNAIMKDGKVIQEFNSTVLRESICSRSTLLQLQSCLEGVVLSGTGKGLLNRFYTLAGKTGTTQVANGNKGYNDHIYQSSFAGYFPAKNPKYSCIVVIKNKPFATKYYGAQVAGPVFSEIANKLFTIDEELYASYQHPKFADSSKSAWNGSTNDFKAIASGIGKPMLDAGKKGKWSKVETNETSLAANNWSERYGIMPDIKGFGLKDALELLERQHLQVIANGKGKVISQSIPEGMAVQKGQTVYLNLGSKID